MHNNVQSNNFVYDALNTHNPFLMYNQGLGGGGPSCWFRNSYRSGYRPLWLYIILLVTTKWEF